MTEPRRRSVSQYSEYLDCQEKYRLKRIVKIPEQPSMWLPAGTAWHYATEMLDKDILWGNPQKAERYRELYEESLAEGVAELEESSGLPRHEFRVSGITKDRPQGENFDWWLRNGIEQIDQYIAWLDTGEYKPMVIAGKPAVELEFDMTLGGVPIRGYIDNVYEDKEGYPIVVDKKTGKSQPTALQLGLYACALKECYGLEVKRGAFYMSRKGALSAPKWLGFLANKNTLTRAFQHMDYSERSGIYIPNISGDCIRCFVNEHCAYYQEKVDAA